MTAPLLDPTHLRRLVDQALLQRTPLGAVRGLDRDRLEMLYTLAWNALAQEQYAQAEKLFKFLVLHQHLEASYWLGLGVCYQRQQRYELALTAFGQASQLAVDNPQPALHGGECHLALRRPKPAQAAFKAALHWSEERPEWSELRQRAEVLLAATQRRLD